MNFSLFQSMKGLIIQIKVIYLWLFITLTKICSWKIFIRDANIEAFDANTITGVIIDLLKKRNLNYKRIVWGASDGANVISGKNSGVWARLR